MKAIMVMFDSLNRHMLPNYGCDWVKAPHFAQLGEKTVTFDNFFVGSMPCMPARRELHTGRYNFLHRSWGPIEPFDDSMPEILKNNGIYSHLVSDHQHYWEDGGATYHSRYSSWEISRGQEGDPWKGYVGEVTQEKTPFRMSELMSKSYGSNLYKQDTVNRSYMKDEKDMPQAVTFKNGLEFIDANHGEDNWFLQIETFDPHEPFHASQRFRDLYPDLDYDEEEFDWPPYAPVLESDGVVGHGKKQYAALVSMCDHYLGKVLEAMDRYGLWEDTMLIVNTDHGFLLGEHGWWSKSVMPTYNEIAHTPFFIWDPRWGRKGERRASLAQTIDLAPTILDFFGLPVPERMEGQILTDTVREDKAVRETALFGYHGGHTNITDGRYVYMRAPAGRENKPLYEYTLMPTHMRCMFKPEELRYIEIAEPFSFMKECRVMKIEAKTGFINPVQYGSKLFDMKTDPGQLVELDDPEEEVRLLNAMAQMMRLDDAPVDQFERMGIPVEGEFTLELLKKQRRESSRSEYFEELGDISYEAGAYQQILTLMNLTEEKERKALFSDFLEFIKGKQKECITKDDVVRFAASLPMEGEKREMSLYFIELAGRTT